MEKINTILKQIINSEKNISLSMDEINAINNEVEKNKKFYELFGFFGFHPTIVSCYLDFLQTINNETLLMEFCLLDISEVYSTETETLLNNLEIIYESNEFNTIVLPNEKIVADLHLLFENRILEIRNKIKI